MAKVKLRNQTHDVDFTRHFFPCPILKGLCVSVQILKLIITQEIPKTHMWEDLPHLDNITLFTEQS